MIKNNNMNKQEIQFLFTEEEYKSAKVREYLPFICPHCKKKSFAQKRRINKYIIEKINIFFCSANCQFQHQKTRKTINCGYCQKEFTIIPSQLRLSKSGLGFCSRSCMGSYHNAHKTTGTRCSKLEMYLQKELVSLYSGLKFDFNKTDAILAELDIYIPSLKLAFELNGIFHYEPIFGKERLEKTKNNDERKFQACLERGIELCILDSSKMKKFKESLGEPYLKIIKDIIDKKIIMLPACAAHAPLP